MNSVFPRPPENGTANNKGTIGKCGTFLFPFMQVFSFPSECQIKISREMSREVAAALVKNFDSIGKFGKILDAFRV